MRERLPRVEGGGLGFEVAVVVEDVLEEREKPLIEILDVEAPDDVGSLEGDIL